MPILQLQDVSKSFGALKVADAVTFDLSEGEALGIIGPNGAGKSTMFNLIAGNLVADAGTIRLAGNDVTRTPPMVRCTAGIGRTFQIPQPFERLTVFENLLVAAAFGSRKREAEVSDRCADILVETGLADRANQPAGSLGLLQRKRLEGDRSEDIAARRDRRRPYRGRMPCSRRDHSRCAPTRHVDHLDRARPSCAQRGGRASARAQFRQDDRHRRATGDHGLPRGA